MTPYELFVQQHAPFAAVFMILVTGGVFVEGMRWVVETLFGWNREELDDCPICSEPVSRKDKLEACPHHVHLSCICKWNTGDVILCPLCRSEQPLSDARHEMLLKLRRLNDELTRFKNMVEANKRGYELFQERSGEQ